MKKFFVYMPEKYLVVMAARMALKDDKFYVLENEAGETVAIFSAESIFGIVSSDGAVS